MGLVFHSANAIADSDDNHSDLDFFKSACVELVKRLLWDTCQLSLTEGCGYPLLDFRCWFLTITRNIPGSRVWLVPLAQKTVGREITLCVMDCCLYSKVGLFCCLFGWETGCTINMAAAPAPVLTVVLVVVAQA